MGQKIGTRSTCVVDAMGQPRGGAQQADSISDRPALLTRTGMGFAALRLDSHRGRAHWVFVVHSKRVCFAEGGSCAGRGRVPLASTPRLNGASALSGTAAFATCWWAT